MIPQALEKANLRHIETSAYCCFLPDLTRFTASYCAGPRPRQTELLKDKLSYQLYDFMMILSRQIYFMSSSLPWRS